MATSAKRNAAQADAEEALRLLAEQQEQGQTFEFDDYAFTGDSLSPALDSLYAEMGIGANDQEATVHVALIEADTKVEANIWRGGPDEYDLENLARQFGSGAYRVRVYVKLANGRKVLKGNKTFVWRLSPADEERRKAVPAQSMQQAAPQQDIAAIMREVMTQLRPPEPVNQLANLKELAQVFQMMQPANPAPAVDQMGVMRNVIEMMNLVKDAGGGNSGGGETNSNDLLLAAMKNFGPMFAQVIGQKVAQDNHAQQMQAQGQQPQLQHNPQSVQHVPQEAQQAAPQTQQEIDDVNLKIKSGLMFLCSMAESGAAPETYAEVVLDNVPADTVQALLTNADPVAFLAGFHAPVEQRREWFSAVIAECRAILEENTDEPELPIAQEVKVMP